MPLYFLLSLFFQGHGHHRHLHSFPTRRSSDLSARSVRLLTRDRSIRTSCGSSCPDRALDASRSVQDRKSTRLNSSHLVISYAVFCLKKKKRKKESNTMKQA